MVAVDVDGVGVSGGDAGCCRTGDGVNSASVAGKIVGVEEEMATGSTVGCCGERAVC